MKAVVTFGVKSRRGVTWWTCAMDPSAARTSFSTAKPAQYDVAVGLDQDGADALLGLCHGGMRLVAGDAALLKRFSRRYLREVSVLETRRGDFR